MLTRMELCELCDFIAGERFRLEDEDGADPVQDEHAAEAWQIVYRRLNG